MDKREILSKDALTTERIKKEFKSQFDLVNYAIRRAEHMIHSGRDTMVKTEIQNKAYQVIQEIAQHKGDPNGFESQDLAGEIEVEEVVEAPVSKKGSSKKKAPVAAARN